MDANHTVALAVGRSARRARPGRWNRDSLGPWDHPFPHAWDARKVSRADPPPDLEAALLLAPEEWQAAYALAKKPLPTPPPRVNEGLRLIAPWVAFWGWRVKKGACYPDQAPGKLHGWRLKPEVPVRAAP